MLDVLNRNLGIPFLIDRPRHTDRVPPTQLRAPRSESPRWPRRAVVTAAVLGVLALAGATATVVQWLNDDDADVTTYERQIAELTEERDELRTANAGLDADVQRLESDVAQALADLDEANARVAGLREEAKTLAGALDAKTDRVGELTAQVNDLALANDELTAELDGVLGMFPIRADASLKGVDVAGVYRATWWPVYNYGLADLALTGARDVRIGHTSEGWLDVMIPGVAEAGLMRTDGALTTTFDSTTAVPPVNGVARTARVTITIYAAETEIGSEGDATVTKLGMTIAISTPEVGDVPAGVALYGATLTPHS